MAIPVTVLTQALRRAGEGDWHGAHEIVQQHEGDAYADWIHAVLHRIEGDLGNARYWYRRSGRALVENESPQAELARIAGVLGDAQLSKPPRKGST
ncbi:MAG: hypothetical protein AMJ64_07525 [Betaproteobacteria bacterium SG8_39]|nr:MAG: hypothetical protein AMJ64_07525 [Betaproteobacteria bacterium SG8_39]